MNDFFEKPTPEDAPKGGSSYPWTKFLEYKSGKTPKSFAAAATPNDVNAGFSYYDKDAAQTVHLDKMAASIVAVLSGVQGTVPDGTRYNNYYSNLVQDTRTQQIEVRLGYGEQSVIVASGIYNEFKSELPQGVGYSKYAIVYLHDTGECMALRLTAGLETALQEAIAAETGQKPNRVNLFDLFQISGRFWAFRFSGVFTKRTKDGLEWSVEGDMFFYPVLKAGIVTSERFPNLVELQDAVSKYVDAWQAEKATKTGEQRKEQPAQAQAQPAAPANQPTRQTSAPALDHNFPTEDVTTYPEDSDLPF